jgi:pimeloyl-ACP methyl ester carboxylesterase
MNYELSGQGNCLVLIHDFGDNLSMWYHQVPEFSKQYRVLTYDVRNFGQTEIGKDPLTVSL